MIIWFERPAFFSSVARAWELWEGEVDIVRVIVVCLSEISQTGGGLMTIDMPTTAPSHPPAQAYRRSAVIIFLHCCWYKSQNYNNIVLCREERHSTRISINYLRSLSLWYRRWLIVIASLYFIFLTFILFPPNILLQKFIYESLIILY